MKILYKNHGATGFLKFRKLNFTRHLNRKLAWFKCTIDISRKYNIKIILSYNFLLNVIVVSYIFWYCIATNYAQSILKGTFWYIVPSDVYDKLHNACILLWVFFRGMQTCFNFPLLQFCISFWQINCWRSSHYCLLITHVSQYYTVRLNLIQKQVHPV